MTHQTPLDVLEKQLLDIISQTDNSIQLGQRVMPRNTFVTKMIESSRDILKKTSIALALLGQVRGEYTIKI